ncbi:hypothetical protein AAEH88_21755, partial [Shewanella algae]|uniref:hypothetical protein n=1 Tax=Shewanella algae TaxID=38313 RepID=UPI00313AF454
MSRPVFFDPTGRRRRRTRLIAMGAIGLLVTMAIVFATTVVNVPAGQPLKLGFERSAPLPLRSQVSRLSHRLTALFGHRAA